MKIIKGCFCLVMIMVVSGCSTGDLRAMNDALAQQNGYSVTYQDQSHTDWVGNVQIKSGVRSGEGFKYVKNTGNEYCKVRLYLEDEDYTTYNLGPGKSTGTTYMSIYNQIDRVRTICGSSSSVYRESF